MFTNYKMRNAKFAKLQNDNVEIIIAHTIVQRGTNCICDVLN